LMLSVANKTSMLNAVDAECRKQAQYAECC
jgi:hypothetical protein